MQPPRRPRTWSRGLLGIPWRALVLIALVALVSWPERHEFDTRVYELLPGARTVQIYAWHRTHGWRPGGTMLWSPRRRRRLAKHWDGSHWPRLPDEERRVAWSRSGRDLFRLYSRASAPTVILPGRDPY